MRIRLLLAAAAAALATAAPAHAQSGPDPFQIGFADVLFSGEDGGRWAQRTAASGASAVRVNVYWNVVGPHEPESPRNPGGRTPAISHDSRLRLIVRPVTAGSAL